MSMSIAEAKLLQDLRRRIEALEHAQRRYRSNPAEHNARRAATASQLHRAIQAVLATASQPNRLTAKHVIRKLDLDALGKPNLSLRTVRQHLAAIRTER